MRDTVEDDPAALAAGLLEDDSSDGGPGRVHTSQPTLPIELVPGDSAESVPLRRVLDVGGWSMAGVLFGLNLVDEFDRVALAVLGPDIQRTFDMSDAALGFLNGVSAVVVFAGAVPLGHLADRAVRTRLVAITSIVWAVFAALGGVTRAVWQLALTRVFNGLGKGNLPVQSSLLADTYPVEGRGRIFALHALANPVGLAVAPLLAGGVTALAGGDEGWRWAFIVLAVPALVLAVAAFALREPARGRFEEEAVLGESTRTVGDEPRTSISAGFDRLKKVRTFYYLMAGLGAIGFAVAGAPAIFNLLLEERFGLDALGRGIVGSIVATGSAVGALLGGRYADRQFRRDPARLVRFIGIALGGFGLLYPLSLAMPHLALLVAVQVVAFVFVSAPLVSINSIVSVVVPFRLRGLGFAMVGIYLFLVGGLLGGSLTGLISDAIGEAGALAIVVPASCLVGGLLIFYGSRFVTGDIALVVEELKEERDERSRMAAAPGEVSQLQVRNLDFSYGPVQVLFDVGMDVKRGEILALLGTNGAGKSTLLRVISGLGLPDRGVLRFDGRTVTYTTAEDRVRLGIVQVPGGRAVFPSLSVRENLVAGAWSFVWETDRVNRRIRQVLDLFPRLDERIDQPAGTLSGGEQQMLALAKALLLEPKLLLIDELSLGLAPAVVQELLAVVERLRDGGVTVVLVEQSVNVALSVADRAIFMEKGEVRFEGAAAELLVRDDLIRAVFLGSEGG